MPKDTLTILIIFVLYLLMMVAVGLFFFRKKMNNSEYVLGGRSLNPWVASMSAQASDMSGWLLTGLPGLAYASISGAKEAIWTAIGLLLGTGLNWFLTARRLRVYTEISGNSLTISSYLSNRFKEMSGSIKIISALVLCVFFTVYAASMFSASANLFSSIFGLPYIWALVIGVIVIVAYVLLGGFLAVSWTDMFQGILMFVALIIVPFLAYSELKADNATELATHLSKIWSLFPKDDESFTYLTIATGLGWGLGYFGMPHILVRFMAIKNHKQVKPAMIIALIWTIITLFASIFIGIFGKYLFPDLANGEMVFILVVRKLFPAVIAGILLAAVLAAIMSTADSQLLVASTSVSSDIFAPIYTAIKKKAPTDKMLLWAARLTVVILSIVAFLFALDDKSSIFKLVQYAWGGLGAAFGPVMLFSLYCKKLNKWGAMSSIAMGAISTLVFKYGLSQFGGVWAVYELIPGFIISTITLFAVSYLTRNKIPAKDKEAINNEFDQMKNIIKTK